MKRVAAITFFLLFLGCAMPAFAQIPKTITAPNLNVPIPGLNFADYPAYYDGTHLTIPFLAAYISAFYKYILGVSMAAAAIMVVYGGFQYIVGSSAARIGTAKKIIADAVIGLILVLAAYTVLQTINPETLNLKGISAKYIEAVAIRISEKYSEGVPIEHMAPFAQPPSLGPTTVTSPATGCGKPKFTVPTSMCGSFDDCYKRFCKEKNYTPPPGLPNLSDLAGFIDIFPPTQKEQILEKGIAFFPILSENCGGPKGCSTTKLFNVKSHGPGAGSNLNWMKGTMVFRPEVRDALVKAGEEAKKRGYFLIIGDGFRTTQSVSIAWCGRLDKQGSAMGLATPGTSPHLLGVAVDVVLYRLTDDNRRYRQLTYGGRPCGQTAAQETLGLEHMRTLEEIMASVGFKHLDSEVHHFNYQGAYEGDCASGNWPGKYKTRDEADCRTVRR